MLHYKTVDDFTLELLKKLQSLRIFNEMRLVGGTSLALQIGHRKSIDIDLFGILNVDFDVLTDELKTIGDVLVLGNSKNIHTYLIDEIKVDIVHFEYPWLRNRLEVDGICLAAIEDIAAMKLGAIIGRGSKKDFIDLYYILQQYDLSQLMSFYGQKYPDGSSFLVLKSLVYFEDAENEATPWMFEDLSWEEVKMTIQKAHAGYLNSGSNYFT
ncbi:MAG: nucleotidyl transferase AbiEii/AbiGii toxin family protein [Cytophagales bacterium]|nr:nucleotidyl transferase AbiEii/AbiGii toxin family protein [Cytophagales bacterium]